MKLLLVDDEFYTREGLRDSIDWESFGITEIMEAENGREALEISKWYCPDIVLTDIRMPQIDGVTFAEHLVMLCPDCRILFLTAYMDTAYMQKAIQLSAVDYIEKPVVLQEVEKSVKKAAESVRKQNRQKHIIENNQKLQRQKLANLLRYRNRDLKIAEQMCRELEIPLKGKFSCVICQSLCKEEEAQTDRTEQIGVFWNVRYYKNAVCFVENGQYIIMLVLSRKNRQQLMKNVEELLAESEPAIAGIGFEVDCIGELYKSYQSATLALERYFYHPQEKIYFFQKESGRIKNIDAGIYVRLNNLLWQHSEQLLPYIDEIFEQFQSTEALKKEHIRIFAGTFAKKLSGEYGDNDFSQCNTLGEVKSLLKHIVSSYLEHQGFVSQYPPLIRDIVHYVHMHYADINLSLQEIADEFHLSKSYLGWIFKRETGVTLRKYIENCRIDMAKEKLLSERWQKMEKIAVLCGFSNANYFSRVFKETVGMTPNQYRKKNCGKETAGV